MRLAALALMVFLIALALVGCGSKCGDLPKTVATVNGEAISCSTFVNQMNSRMGRDILGNLMTFWFFSTPVIYSMNLPQIQNSPALRTLLNMNPMTHIIGGYHSALYYGELIHWKKLGVTLIAGLVLFWAGYRVFDRLRDSFPEEV